MPSQTNCHSFVGRQSVYKRRSKDMVTNCIETNEFVWNMPTYNRSLDVISSVLETTEDEFEVGNIKKASSKLVRPPRVANSPASFECRVISIVRVANEHHGAEDFWTAFDGG